MPSSHSSPAVNGDLCLVTLLFLGVSFAAACGGQPLPPPGSESGSSSPVAKRAANVADDCAQEPGKPAPEPLKREYRGVAAKARCDREVYTIMGGVVHSLDVPCEYCHVKDDYPAMTHNKRVANWMAQELIPSIRAKTGQDVWCSDCHHVGDKGTPKPLGNPRKKSQAIEWMNTQLVARFETKDGEPLYCKSCHVGNVGSPEFKSKLFLEDLLGDQSFPPAELSAPAPKPGSEPAAGPDADTPEADAGAPDKVPDMGDRK
ncbi:MAG: hypothetical protein AB7K71_26050 [Polyangiaceae bacterium]